MTPTIRVDDEVYAAMQAEAEPFTDTPNAVLRRRFGLPARNSPEPAGHESTRADGTGSGTMGAKRVKDRKAAARTLGRKRAPKGVLLPETEYEGPILRVLLARGGEAPAREATDALESELDGKLTGLDRERTSSGEIRWRNRAQFARLALVKRGLIDNEAPRGIWRLTAAGRDEAAGA